MKTIIAVLLSSILFLAVFVLTPTKFDCRSCNCTENMTPPGVGVYK